MQPDRRNDLIPGPDPGACPHCGVWRKAGCWHDCEVEMRHRDEEIERLRQALTATQPFCPICGLPGTCGLPIPCDRAFLTSSADPWR